jgi:hypothetical protein
VRPAPTALATRRLVIGALAVATVAALAMLFLRGGDSAGAAGDFTTSHDRVVAAIHEVPLAAANVTRALELEKFNTRINTLLNEMGQERDVFRSIARDEEGAGRAAATAAAGATVDAIAATDQYRRAVAFSKELAVAQAAQVRLDTAVAALDAAAAAWKSA